MRVFNRTDKSVLSTWWWTVDRPLLLALILLMLIGVFMVSVASPSVAQRLDLESFHFTIRHLFFLAPAFLILIGVSMLPPRHIWRLSLAGLIASLCAMGLVLVLGQEIQGAKRWLPLFGFSLQPSEFAKPALVVVIAWLISVQMEKHRDMPGLADFIPSGIFYLICIVLLALQPDFGMAFVVTCIFGTQIFLAGMPLRWLTLFLGLLVSGVFLAYMVFDHVKSRFDRFFNPEKGDTYQIEQSLEAFRHGGIAGTGPGQGTIKLHLPDAHADFIFSVAGEELGFIFVVCLIGLYAFVILRGFNRIMDSGNLFVVLAVAGLLVQFALQAFIHMGSSMNILPTKGMTLPFISYGGSSLLAMSYSMGVVLSLTRYRQKRNTGKAMFSSKPLTGAL